MHMAGSILPSEDCRTLLPIAFANGVLQVERLTERETYALAWTAIDAAPVYLAAHPNGHSCRCLAERMATDTAERAEAQREYIVRCGGHAVSPDALAAALRGATFNQSDFWSNLS